MSGMNVIYDQSTQRVPIKAWLDHHELEAGALEQAVHLASLPFAHKHVALMPDVHQGYGMPVGGVLAARGYIVPNAIGVDIGCGMIATQTDLPAAALQEPHKSGGTVLQALTGAIMRAVPVGLPPGGVHKEAQSVTPIQFDGGINEQPPKLVDTWDRMAYQMGTLGSGNHFLEIQADEAGQVWLMLHSGSRALGKAVCDHYNQAAVVLNERYFSQVPKAWELAFLPIEDELGQHYLTWMGLCLSFAQENRQRMMARMLEALAFVSPQGYVSVSQTIETHHNYAALEHHFGTNVWVHRKGACRARTGELLIIPGSMETGSYIGRGLGNLESFQSCSHGAGRRMSRGAARKARTVDDMVASLHAKGIVLATHKVDSVLDEAGHAYKDVVAVLANEADLVEPIYTLRPLGVVKG